MYLNEIVYLKQEIEARLTLTLDVFKFFIFIKIHVYSNWLTLTLDVFKCWIKKRYL